MIHSMTGFGEARRADARHTYHVEIRSVNNRYLKVTAHLPEHLAFLETVVERWVRGRVLRGSVVLRVNVKDVGAAAAEHVNADALRAYVAQLRQAMGPDARTMIDLATLLSLPGAFEDHEVSEAERGAQVETIESLVNEALSRLIEMRVREGEALQRDLVNYCRTIRTAVATIRTRAPSVVEEYRDRLHTRIQQLIAGSGVQLAADELIKEVAIFAERSDISEELSRLEGHLDAFESALSDSEPPGRKLEFIGQEMLREANTMGSKSGDATISRSIVEIKSAVDRIKEQVQNAE